MKHLRYLYVMAWALALWACSPDEYPGLDAPVPPGGLTYTVTQESGYDNKVFLENQTPGIIPYWNYVLGTSNRAKDTVTFPFAGEYWIKLTAFGRAVTTTDSTMVTVTENDAEFFSAPEWSFLTNGADGKTWELDMTSPIGWAGLDYPAPTGDNWNWFPEYQSWSMENKDWGEMTFDLDGNFNVSVSQTALEGDAKTTTSGTFAMDLANNRMKFYGAKMLYGGDYASAVGGWTDVYLLELTETTLRLLVPGADGSNQIMFHYKPKI